MLLSPREPLPLNEFLKKLCERVSPADERVMRAFFPGKPPTREKNIIVLLGPDITIPKDAQHIANTLFDEEHERVGYDGKSLFLPVRLRRELGGRRPIPFLKTPFRSTYRKIYWSDSFQSLCDLKRVRIQH